MTNDMTRGNPVRLILAFMIPTFLGNIFQQFYNLVDSVVAGNSYNLNLGSAMSLVLMVIVLLCMSFTSSFDESEMEGVM